jgi:hypothetical protein
MDFCVRFLKQSHPKFIGVFVPSKDGVRPRPTNIARQIGIDRDIDPLPLLEEAAAN